MLSLSLSYTYDCDSNSLSFVEAFYEALFN